MPREGCGSPISATRASASSIGTAGTWAAGETRETRPSPCGSRPASRRAERISTSRTLGTGGSSTTPSRASGKRPRADSSGGAEAGEAGQIYPAARNGNAVRGVASGGSVGNRWRSDDSGRPFARPTGIALDGRQGILYVVNSATNVVAKIVLAGGKKP